MDFVKEEWNGQLLAEAKRVLTPRSVSNDLALMQLLSHQVQVPRRIPVSAGIGQGENYFGSSVTKVFGNNERVIPITFDW